MNRVENWLCASSLWSYITRKRLLPWLVAGSELGDHLLELGAGPGAATSELRRLVRRVTSLEYSHAFAARLRENAHDYSACVVQGDAAVLPFADGAFSSAIAILVLHHLRTKELQDRALAEAWRVLRPGGVFLALEIPAGWFNRAIHLQSTFVPVDPALARQRFETTGFADVGAERRGSVFRIRALRSSQS